MAANGSAVWRVRPSGNNNNGGGFDTAISSAATGTHGSLSGITFTDATAAAFTTGMVGSAIIITNVGQFKIASRVDASNITLTIGAAGTLPAISGNLAWTVGSGQDYSQQNAAQVTQSGGTITTATTTLTDTGASFTSALIGNAIRVAGTGITTTYTFITAVPTGTTLTLQTSPGTSGTAVTYNVGGGWANFVTNTTSSGPLVNSNVVYILGSGTPNPASYTYDYTVSSSFIPFAGFITFMNDPGTPGSRFSPDTTGGMPVIKFNSATSLFNVNGSNNALVAIGLYFVGAAGATAGSYVFLSTLSGVITNSIASYGCVFDQFGLDIGLFQFTGTSTGSVASSGIVIGCEIFSSVGAGVGTASGVNFPGGRTVAIISDCNIHDCISLGISLGTNSSPFTQSAFIRNCIIAKCQLGGIYSASEVVPVIVNCTIDGNGGTAINVDSNSGPTYVYNTIISNHTTGGGAGLGGVSSYFSGFALCDYNTYYNNTTDVTGGTNYGAHDTFGIANPYVGQSTENYTLV